MHLHLDPVAAISGGVFDRAKTTEDDYEVRGESSEAFDYFFLVISWWLVIRCLEWPSSEPLVVQCRH